MNHFIDNHWLLALVFIGGTINGIANVINRVIRHLNIKAAGWPPAHLDADGDWPIKEE